jgi:4-diphosphocytidyl-2-C-methyl-D-erythritol kinase
VATTCNWVRVFAPAKINLFLHVGSKRADGYHDLQSLVTFVEAGDALEIASAPRLSLEIDGPFGQALARDSNNLVLKSGRALGESLGKDLHARLKLTKNLPVASGIGGGSADAAATLRGLAELWGTAPATVELAASIGSDIPVCLASRTAWMEGRGERVTLLDDLPAMDLVLANPGVALPTAGVFSLLVDRSGTGGPSPPRDLTSLADLVRYLQVTRNDLEAPARSIAPIIDEVLQSLRSRGALLARMCGSGATCFGLYSNAADAAEATRAITMSYPQWWVRATRIAQQDIGMPEILNQ